MKSPDRVFIAIALLFLTILGVCHQRHIERLEAELLRHEAAMWDHQTDWELAMYVEREKRIADLRAEFNKCIFTLSHPDGKLTNIIIWKPEHE